MQRSLAGVFFLVAAVAIGIAVGVWWLDRVVFTPDATRGRTEAILDDPDIRAEVVAVVTAGTSAVVERPPEELGPFVDQIVGSRPGAVVMAEIVADAHARVIGANDELVTVTGEQLVQIVRDERAVEIASLTLPVPRVGTLDALGTVVTWAPPILLGLGLLCILLGLLTRPEGRDIRRGLGELAVAIAVSVVVFGLLVPVFLVPSIDDSAWTQLAPRLASRSAAIVIVGASALAVVGLALILT
ncbi:MAG: hypothetical protein MUE78_01050, partial [Ilumatobacteraceae bacterium]|nr:hypothetical protein [Ilumatobacteraceae bacterium]